MRDPALILVVDDNEANLDILETRLASQGYATARAMDGEAALAVAREQEPDLILLDIMMPKIDGIEVCRQLKSDAALPFTPIILVTAKADTKDVVRGLDAGADDYLTKPVDQAALSARVRSMLRIKALHDTVQHQSRELADWNGTLEARVAAQLAELEGAQRMRRFLSPQLADVILKSGDDKLLESHRREITVVFCDLRGFTAFAESAEPEEVMAVLNEYHAAMGALIFEYEGTLERFTGDGLMVFFNDPMPCPDPAARAVRMAAAMRVRHGALSVKWQKLGHELGFGVGIASGFATLGKIGFEGRFDYGAIGSVTNLAARLCDHAQHGQILISQRVEAALDGLARTEALPVLELKGFRRPVGVYNVVDLA
ncbi:MAG: response regulator [Proteobacteria bacterium]|nr:response regulator [Pseudomonadota bacterium]